MNSNDLLFTLEQLRALDAVVQAGSFAGAAASLGRATSAVSYAIRTLEARVGLELFDRSGHRAVLTSAGEVLLGEARRTLERARRMQHRAAQLREGWEPRLDVVVDGAVPMPPVMSALRALTTEGVPTRIGLSVEYLSGVQERFDDDEATLMITLDHKPTPELVARGLAPVPMRLVVRPDHPLMELATVSTGPRTAVGREALADFVELVVMDSSASGRSQPPRLALGSPHVFQLTDFQSKREALLEGVGFGWLPAHLADPLLADDTLAALHLEDAGDFVFSPSLVYRRDAPLGRGAQRFLELLG